MAQLYQSNRLPAGCWRRTISRPYSIGLLFTVALSSLLAGSGCRLRPASSDKPSTPVAMPNAEITRAFYTGVIALQVGEDDRAEAGLNRAIQLAPSDPAPLANLGLLRLRQGNLEAAANLMSKARALAPEVASLDYLDGTVAARQGKFTEALTLLKEADRKDPNNPRFLWSLEQALERQGAVAEAQQALGKIIALHPDNIAALVESIRVAARAGNRAILGERIEALGRLSREWPPEARKQFSTLRTAAAAPDPRGASVRAAFLRNVLQRLPAFRSSVEALEGLNAEGMEPIDRFLVLQTPSNTPAPADQALTFAVETIGSAAPSQPSSPVEAVRIAALDPEGTVGIFAVGAKTWNRQDKASMAYPFPGPVAGSDALLPLDTNYDFRTDFAVAGEGGFRLYRAAGDKGGYIDVTAATKLSPAVIKGRYTGAWATDIEADGDLDIVLGSASGTPTVLRNNGDGTFAPIRPFEGANGLRGFAWADVEGGGVPDAALIDQGGHLRVFHNARSGVFTKMPAADVALAGAKAVAVTVADTDNDGLLDFVVLLADGRVVAVRAATRGDNASSSWRLDPLFQSSLPVASAASARLLCGDFDNNGAVDFAVSGTTTTEVWLANGDPKGSQNRSARGAAAYQMLPLLALTADDIGVLDATSGSICLAGRDASGRPVIGRPKGTRSYGFQVIRPRAKETTGDQRINSFGIGGEMQIRAGLLLATRAITGPLVHFGLGDQAGADALRIVWPNGSVRAEFDLKPNVSLAAEQRLKGSCPWLFAWDGQKMGFITDCIWRSPLGLRINAQTTAGVAMTEDWVKIAGSRLIPRPDPRGGFYDLRIAAELWETHFFDYLDLMTVDHPAGTEVWVDERFAIPPPPLAVVTTGPLHPVARAVDDRGADMTDVLQDRDGRHVDSFGRGAYQGVTRDHYLELQLPPEAAAARSGPVYLVCFGWLHPTDSSINVALAQNASTAPPKGLSLETPNGKGGWRVARQGLGFPAGKVKTIVLRIDDVFTSTPSVVAPYVVRLRTNLEIYWDQVGWAEGVPSSTPPTRLTRLPLSGADLDYRGFSQVSAAGRSSPELPTAYDLLSGAGQRWRDLEGYYTRLGDVRPLLTATDDRYVIMNAGDELRLRFPAKAAPLVPTGWKRDYVLIGDGWVKDGDYNTGFSRTVLPLPSHGNTAYDRPPSQLEDDPVFQRHPGDWTEYHTRYVGPRAFVRAMVPPPKR